MTKGMEEYFFPICYIPVPHYFTVDLYLNPSLTIKEIEILTGTFASIEESHYFHSEVKLSYESNFDEYLSFIKKKHI